MIVIIVNLYRCDVKPFVDSALVDGSTSDLRKFADDLVTRVASLKSLTAKRRVQKTGLRHHAKDALS